MTERLMVTGGLGFIGSNFIRHMLEAHTELSILNLDNLSYGSNPANLRDIPEGPKYRFVKGDINDFDMMLALTHDIGAVVNFAAETHVDRSISNPRNFFAANVQGPLNLLEVCRKRDMMFLQVSTDEVYGSVWGLQGFREEDRLNPSSPYAASKAAADLLVNAYHKTYGLRTFITRCTNNFGPYQFPEKLIPKTVIRAHLASKIPVYGTGRQIRDWIQVRDHCEALNLVLERGSPGEIYNVAGGNQVTNLELVEKILEIMRKPMSLIEHVEDRPGHDFRYSLDPSKTTVALGWKPKQTFPQTLRETVEWYLGNEEWWRPLINEHILSPTPWRESW
jgi:dTDP-glucose 4,6-dehydratase